MSSPPQIEIATPQARLYGEPLVELGTERMLMTHGPSVLSGGSAALQDALDAVPWYHS